MKTLFKFSSLLLLVLFISKSTAQIQYTRAYDKTGINVFEPSKMDQTAYDGFKIRIGGSFTQDFQSFKVENKANYVPTSGTNRLNKK